MKKILPWIGLIVVVAIGLTIYGNRANAKRQEFVLSPDVKTFEQFVAHFAWEKRFATINVDGVTYVEVASPVVAWTFPSGPACYLFGTNGSLVDWTMDIGDDGRYQKQWGQTGRKILSIDAIRKDILTTRSR